MGIFPQRPYLFVLAMVFFFVSGCGEEKTGYAPHGSKRTENKGNRLVLGVLPSLPPTRLIKTFQPLADYLTKKTGFDVVIATAPNFDLYTERLRNGEYELAFPNPYQYIMASKTPGYKPLVRVSGLPFQGLIVVRKDSGIAGIRDLKGKTIAYPDPFALAATMQVRAYLKREGIHPEKDTTESYAASQDSVLLGVHDKLFDAAGTWPEALEALPDDVRKELRVLASTETLPHRPIAVRADIFPVVAGKVKDALLGMSGDPEGLKILISLGYKGFEEAFDKDYNVVREWAKRNGYPYGT